MSKIKGKLLADGSTLVMVHDLVEENGKTIKENNLARAHNIPVGALVEVDDKGERRQLYVVYHARDCDGTPLYSLSEYPTDIIKREGFYNPGWRNGWSEPFLKIVK